VKLKVLPFITLLLGPSLPLMSLAAASGTSSTASSSASTAFRDRAHTALLRSLADEQGWVRVHAAEALIAIGDSIAARSAYERELPALEAGPLRVGAWRVLAATAQAAAERANYLEKIASVLSTPEAADRLQSIESLCKLRAPMTGSVLAQVREMSTGPEGERPLGWWALHVSGDTAAPGRLVALLSSSDPTIRLRAAYALRWVGTTDAALLVSLAIAADREPVASPAYPYLLSAALTLNAAPARVAAWLQSADLVLRTGAAGARYELAQTIAGRHPRADLARYADTADRSNGDERIGAALITWTLAGSLPSAERSPSR
jgi:hypothetical protein